MFLVTKIAFKLFFSKNPNRNKRFSFLTIASIFGISLGIISLLLALGFVNGFEKGINDKIFSLSPHIQLHPKDLLKTEELNSISEELKFSNKEIEYSSIVYSQQCIVSNENQIEGGVITSFDENVFQDKIKKLVKNRIKNVTPNENLYSVFIGENLRKKLKLEIKDEFIISANYGENVFIFNAKIAGIFESGIDEVDGYQIYMSKNEIENIFGKILPESYIELKCKNISNINLVHDKIIKQYSDQFYISTIYKNYKNIFTWVEFQKKPTPIFMGILLIVSIFNLISFLLTSIIEKKYTIGILQTLGMNNSEIKKTFLVKGLILSTIGIVIGLLAVIILMFIQNNYFIIQLPADIYIVKDVKIILTYLDFLKVVIFTYLITMVAVIIPIRNIRKISPLEIIRK